MLGFYDYTVILTYISALSAGLGIFITLSGFGHPFVGCFFLMICGLCDAFDGKVARSKPNRTKAEQNFGIQIDSLCDLIAFGVLPACIGNAMLRIWPIPEKLARIKIFPSLQVDGYTIGFFWLILLLYILAALIRLAYFNVMEEERQNEEGGVRKTYEGLPVTTSSLIFPFVLLLQYILPWDMTLVYFMVMAITGFMFLSKIKVPKPGTKGIMAMIGVGVVMFVVLLVFYLVRTGVL